jgi:hypothetical protein
VRPGRVEERIDREQGGGGDEQANADAVLRYVPRSSTRNATAGTR